MGELIYGRDKAGFVGVIRDRGRETYVAVGDDYYRIGDIPSDVAARLGLKLGDRIVVRTRTEIDREPAAGGTIPAEPEPKRVVFRQFT